MATKSNAIRRGGGSIAADAVIYTVLTLLALLMIFPFYNMVLISVAPYAEVASGQLYLWPRGWDFNNYKIIFSDPKLLRAFGISGFNTVFGTALAMAVTTSAGYALSRKSLPGRGWILTLFVITMYFGGGLIPWYLVLQDLGFIDNIFVMTVPSCLSVYNMILMKNYFNTIPESLPESARIDGANEFPHNGTDSHTLRRAYNGYDIAVLRGGLLERVVERYDIHTAEVQSGAVAAAAAQDSHRVHA